MRPDDRRSHFASSGRRDDAPLEQPLDADLAALDAELGEAGAQASRSLHGRTQPTRFFSGKLRDGLIGAYAAPAMDAGAADVALPRESQRGSRLRADLAVGGEAWAPTPLEPRLARRTPTVLPRARWALLAAAALTGVLVAGALGARLDWLLPTPTTEATDPQATLPAYNPDATPAPSNDVVAPPIPTAKPAVEPTPATTKPPATEPAATPKPTPKPTPTPKPRRNPSRPNRRSDRWISQRRPVRAGSSWTGPSPRPALPTTTCCGA